MGGVWWKLRNILQKELNASELTVSVPQWAIAQGQCIENVFHDRVISGVRLQAMVAHMRQGH